MKIIEDRTEQYVVVQGDEEADSQFINSVHDWLGRDGIGAGWEISSTRQLDLGEPSWFCSLPSKVRRRDTIGTSL